MDFNSFVVTSIQNEQNHSWNKYTRYLRGCSLKICSPKTVERRLRLFPHILAPLTVPPSLFGDSISVTSSEGFLFSSISYSWKCPHSGQIWQSEVVGCCSLILLTTSHSPQSMVLLPYGLRLHLPFHSRYISLWEMTIHIFPTMERLSSGFYGFSKNLFSPFSYCMSSHRRTLYFFKSFCLKL